RKDGTDVAGATTATLTLTNARPAQAGNYSVVVTNAAGTIASRAAQLVVVPAALDAPTIQAWHFSASGGKQPIALNAVHVGDVVTVTTTASLTARAGWRHDILIRRPGVTAA